MLANKGKGGRDYGVLGFCKISFDTPCSRYLGVQVSVCVFGGHPCHIQTGVQFRDSVCTVEVSQNNNYEGTLERF